jgi:hypothetical protein
MTSAEAKISVGVRFRTVSEPVRTAREAAAVARKCAPAAIVRVCGKVRDGRPAAEAGRTAAMDTAEARATAAPEMRRSAQTWATPEMGCAASKVRGAASKMRRAAAHCMGHSTATAEMRSSAPADVRRSAATTEMGAPADRWRSATTDMWRSATTTDVWSSGSRIGSAHQSCGHDGNTEDLDL